MCLAPNCISRELVLNYYVLLRVGSSTTNKARKEERRSLLYGMSKPTRTFHHKCPRVDSKSRHCTLLFWKLAGARVPMGLAILSFFVGVKKNTSYPILKVREIKTYEAWGVEGCFLSKTLRKAALRQWRGGAREGGFWQLQKLGPTVRSPQNTGLADAAVQTFPELLAPRPKL